MTKPENLSIKKWAVEDRPREKLMGKGIQALSDTELLAIILRNGTVELSAVELARQLLQHSGNNLNNLGKLTVKELTMFKGIGEAKAITIVAALELGKRRKLAGITDKPSIKSSRDVYDIFHPLLADLPYEEFWILLLNRSNRVVKKVKISQGGVAGTVIDNRLILKTAIENLASSVILCHNHPSGNLNPSEADADITGKLKVAAEYMDIKLLDHIIVADHAYFSFADEGRI
ncbi:MAG: DNA repair protein RadC [Bacteroidales bacterium]|nr:DNA repair protein RadC [Bacteroidales bacterium]